MLTILYKEDGFAEDDDLRSQEELDYIRASFVMEREV
jgi:hypothetical protein